MMTLRGVITLLIGVFLFPLQIFEDPVGFVFLKTMKPCTQFKCHHHCKILTGIAVTTKSSPVGRVTAVTQLPFRRLGQQQIAADQLALSSSPLSLVGSLLSWSLLTPTVSQFITGRIRHHHHCDSINSDEQQISI